MKQIEIKIKQASEQSGVSYSKIKNRMLEGMTLEEAVSYQPKKSGTRDKARGKATAVMKDTYPSFDINLCKQWALKWPSVSTNTASWLNG